MQRVTALAAALLMTLASSVFAAEAASAKGDPVKGKEIVDKVCAACHGVDGNSAAAANPSLAGQHPEYIVKQLTEFKKQVRKNPVMLGMATPLSDADMHNVAAYFGAQQPKERGASDKALIEAGKKIYRGGIANKGLPACMACHGPSGAGIPVQYPRVGGQHAGYIEAQLKAFRSGERTNNVPMQQIAAKMSDNDIKAVAQFMQALH
ncbi:Cytochrome c553 [Andreprevotia lacus DSM 23236]|jgi:cytochrome c553|uniref:Cytochrome c553 n=1 Tax=Andreprevotia lacus DSM 23236 TaxID=1121001 RepID=A0A1W1XST2_9NEIS|nr:c-type cytochrome [Andreprevotia lacus]SMC26947.1 Cytochrome c553 [Andreprevotia lacus DSM 23236]